jgi:hypothetical protein
MLGFLKPKKKFTLTDSTKKRIEKGTIKHNLPELELLSELKEGLFCKSKELEIGYYINVHKTNYLRSSLTSVSLHKNQSLTKRPLSQISLLSL